MAKGLGKGLNALFPGESLKQSEQVEQIDLKLLKPNPYQPRKVFEEESLKELTESIREHGILQPIIVRKKAGSMKSSSAKGDSGLPEKRDSSPCRQWFAT